MENLEIEKILTLSTAHISEKANKWLDNEKQCELVCYRKGRYGWFIFVPEQDELDKLIDSDNIPESLMNCMVFAKAKNCSWLCLDCDGKVLDQLREYNW